ncbi:hypothetical protein P3W45_000821 [Vairimorpha bombi]
MKHEDINNIKKGNLLNTQLYESDLSKNKVHPLFNLDNLIYLNIRNCHLSVAQLDFIMDLPKLQTPDISDNRLVNETVFKIQNIKSLNTVYMEGCNLSPETFEGF